MKLEYSGYLLILKLFSTVLTKSFIMNFLTILLLPDFLLCPQAQFVKVDVTLNMTILDEGFCDIQNNQGRGKGYQPKPSVITEKP